MRLDGEVSGIGGTAGGPDFSFGARLSRPGMPDPDTNAYIQGLIEREDEEDYRADRGSIELGFTRVVNDTLSGEIGVGYSYERTEDALGVARFSTLTLPLSATWDRRDDTVNATRGTFLKADVEPFLGFEDAGTGARLALDGRVYRGLGEGGRFVLAGRVQGGAVLGSELAETPRDYLFFSGGGGTVRGQPYQSLGVESPCSQPAAGCSVTTGGRSFVGLSAEVRAQVGNKLGLVGFVDAGFVSADVFEGGDWHSGAGVGVRYNTGIGPIRLDVAAPVGGNTGDGVQVYIGIGQSF